MVKSGDVWCGASEKFPQKLPNISVTFYYRVNVEAEAGFSKGVFVCTTLRFCCAQGAGSMWFLKGWYVCCQHRFHCVSQDFTGFHWKLILQSNWNFVWLAPNQLSECLVTRTLSDYIQWPYSPGYSYIEIISFGDISICVTLLGRFLISWHCPGEGGLHEMKIFPVGRRSLKAPNS